MERKSTKLNNLARLLAVGSITSVITTLSSKDVDLEAYRHCPPVQGALVAKVRDDTPIYIDDQVSETDENLYKVFEFMSLCDSEELKQAAGKLAFLRTNGYVDVIRGSFRREPAEVVFIGGWKGIPDPRSSTYKIFYTPDLLTDPKTDSVDRAIFSLKALYMFEEVIEIEGTAAEKTAIDRSELEIKSWSKALQVAEKLKAQIKNPYILNLLDRYSQLGQEDFSVYWKKTATDNAPGVYP